MKQSHLFTKTSKTVQENMDSPNARFLTQAGFVDQLMAGSYTFLPLGLRVLNKVQNIVREEMNAVGGQEVLMPALQPREPWEQTKRWGNPGPEVMFQFKGAGDRDVGLGWTHEEIVTPLVQKFVHSYKDLPVAVYQIQNKFRNELRAKSGILRGREFSMKDMYSFHVSVEDMERYYNEVLEAYRKVFKRCGIVAIPTEASGGAFSKVSHEFQMPTESGEDTIYVNEAGDYAWNKEIAPNVKDGDQAPDGSGKVKEVKAIEVGNIFKLNRRFTDPFEFTFTDEAGQRQPIYMGCYGIGPSRVMGAIIEAHHDDRGMIWPKSVAPFGVHLISLGAKDATMHERVMKESEAVYAALTAAGVEVLWDDRTDASAGEKFADSDLIGIPLRLVISERTLKENACEWKERTAQESSSVPLADVVARVATFVQS